MRHPSRAGIIALSALAAVAVSCSSGSSARPADTSNSTPGRPSSTGVVKIIRPSDGTDLTGPTIQLRVALTGARIIKPTTTNLKPDEGHLHVLLDGRLISMTLGVVQEIPNVPSGLHVVRVEFVASDHIPFNPRVVDSVSFKVR